eukprot:TRINITY_DN18063_c0_g1_i1.p1 TRINITY_DN18063_c0_g1~~TRINITY_DN18063_c0_g1_i1.p1  ORF type:complete len:404 (-),score=62.60 TRINITY_DN18063_c0_g1_i1:452-1663(-)
MTTKEKAKALDDDVQHDLFHLLRATCAKHKFRAWDKLVNQIQRAGIADVPLSTFNMEGCVLDTKGTRVLVKLILSCPHLTHLNLENTQLQEEGLSLIGRALQRRKNVRILNVSRNNLSTRACMAYLKDLTANNGISHLDLSNNQLKGKSAINLCSAITISSSLQLVNLEETQLDEKAIIALTRGLALNESILDLRLGGNNLGPRCALHLAKAVKTNTTLKSLDLKHNNIQDIGAVHLANSLGYNSSLFSLVLWNNKIQKEGITALATNLAKTNSTLRNLDIGSNEINPQSGVSELKRILKSKFLASIGLASCGIGSEAAIALAEALEGNSNLTRMDLRNNNMGIAGLMALSAALKLNNALQFVAYDLQPSDTEENSLEETLTAEIAKCCVRNMQIAREAKAKQ